MIMMHKIYPGPAFMACLDHVGVTGRQYGNCGNRLIGFVYWKDLGLMFLPMQAINYLELDLKFSI